MNAKPCPACHGTGRTINHGEMGRSLKRLREARGVGLRQLAKTLRVSPSYISNMEHGDRHWPMRLTERYVRTLQKKGQGQ